MPGKKDEIKQRIVDGAKRLFSLYGFSRTTVDEISKNLRISKKTIYQHFRSKDALVEAVFYSILDPAFRAANEIIDSKLGFYESVKALFKVLQGIFSQITPAMFNDLQGHPRLWEKINLRREQVIKRYTELIERGQKDGVVRKDINSKFISNLIMQLVRHFATPRTVIELNITPTEMANSILSIIMTGILTEKGRKRIKSKGEKDED